MTASDPPLIDLAEFLFEAPLYAAFTIFGDSLVFAAELYTQRFAVDGYCIECGREATFHKVGDAIFHAQAVADLVNMVDRILPIEIFCTRQPKSHRIHFWLYLSEGRVQKIGQMPSLADIANDETKKYRSVLKGEDAADFHRAVGLAAHGVGIGSFVYLRRVLERLIERTFREHQSENGWADDALPQRVADRITFLKRYLPDFLIENARIYAVLSKGIHALSEDECRTIFNVLMAAVVEILEDEKAAKEKAARRKATAEELKKLG